MNVTSETGPVGAGGAATDRGDARAATHELFRQLATSPDDEDAKGEIRNQLVEMHLPLVEHLASRFRGRGEPFDDLVQVGTIGLIKSVDRFDTERGVEFATYATPTIVGELKRYFRDKGWAIRVPRRLQELRISIAAETAELTQELGRAPTVAELAQKLNVNQDLVLEGLESTNAYATLSLDVSDHGGEEAPAVLETLGREDDQIAGVEYREALRPLLSKLPEREKRILVLRFFRGMTQSQIADDVGVSQMHVSRLLSRTLRRLREELLTDS